MDAKLVEKYRGQRIAIAVSGGMDSVCLLHLFSENATRLNIQLSALTCEHGIRGEEAKRDVAFVRALCEEMKIPLTIFSADVVARAKKSRRGLEEEGRLFRYECFDEIIRSGKADFVATAHHADDVAETVLFRLARGTSVSGIASIRERDGVIRPFLGVSRAEIASYMAERGYEYREDSTNGDEAFTRNLIRKRVMPLLEEVTHGANGHIAEFARRAGEDDAYLEGLAEESVRRDRGGIYVPVSLARPVFLRACLYAMRLLGCQRDYTQALLTETERLKDLQSGRRISLKGGLQAIREGGEIAICLPDGTACGEVALHEGEIPFGDRILFVGTTERAGALYCDLSEIPSDSVIRQRREGDFFTPFGGRRKTLKKFLSDRKIPARRGRELPLIASGSEILAIFGVEISDKIKVTDQTARRGYLSVEPK